MLQRGGESRREHEGSENRPQRSIVDTFDQYIREVVRGARGECGTIAAAERREADKGKTRKLASQRDRAISIGSGSPDVDENGVGELGAQRRDEIGSAAHDDDAAFPPRKGAAQRDARTFALREGDDMWRGHERSRGLGEHLSGARQRLDDQLVRALQDRSRIGV